MRILFSCAGSSDPARGLHDGGIMHIMRHYRPEKVFLFLTAEVSEWEKQDDRFQMMLDYILEHWDGYTPELEKLQFQIKDPSDLDALDVPMHSVMDELAENYPDAEILINLSSGTPQMKMILSQIVLDLRYHATGIQVKNFEKQSGTSVRTNSKTYDVELELEFNEDESPDAPNRCSEPKMLYLQKNHRWKQIEALLEQRNYGAVEAMADLLPPVSAAIVHHLAARNRLEDREAHLAARNIPNHSSLYPIKNVPNRDRSDYKEVVEYFLMMKNMQYAGRFSDFVLRMNPLVIRLQAAMLDDLLREHYGFSSDAIISTDRQGRRKWMPEQIQERIPELWTHILTRLNKELTDCDISMYLLNIVLSYFPDIPSQIGRLFELCEKLNISRNAVAHALEELTDAEIKQVIGCSCSELTKMMEGAIIKIYPECDPAIFKVYENYTRMVLERK